ncbi:hypothetical protein PLESTB_001398200 [Pleodorina starrii]|uniref:Uncharacterized protein n=1 Tax=Pleodorina starrii TaxID=330485 RepID=A0A9W6BWD8_9CHLO|nr:hypothetical protein PLESTM_000534100 [Pleodorina starrii]GLC58761.1 hypothetical protein PLESTB_001398200 [Pleodorina starrii]GLC75152.1 hypothetical protein PLESTF_001600800 [Pleodorina starrii]
MGWHERAANKAESVISEQISKVDGETTPATKRARGDGSLASIGNFVASATQTFVFLKNLALFFFTTNTALHLIENPYLVKACAAVGIKLPSRFKLATTMLDEAHAELAGEIEKEWKDGGDTLAAICTDGGLAGSPPKELPNSPNF